VDRGEGWWSGHLVTLTHTPLLSPLILLPPLTSQAPWMELEHGCKLPLGAWSCQQLVEEGKQHAALARGSFFSLPLGCMISSCPNPLESTLSSHPWGRAKDKLLGFSVQSFS
jgi:hypothetical protein